MQPAENGVRPATPPPTVEHLPPESLPTPWDRFILPPKSQFDELVESVGRDGVLEPLRASARLNVVSGHMRRRAAVACGLKTVPVIVDHAMTTDEQELRAVAQFDVKSNRKAEDTGALVAAYIARSGCTDADAAAVFGFSAAKVSRLLGIVAQGPEVQAALRDGLITQGAAVVLRRAPDDRRAEFLRQAVEEKLKPAELLARVRPRKGGRRRPVAVTVGRITVLIPADMPPADAMEPLRVKLFSALSKAAVLNLDAASLPRIVEGLGR